ncbi:hypothetical protein [uncultured Sphingomonas sp.]|uniref:hypothetical protein n=1 Tax=uncultured Sphingomonas sp. TaxID=158754 RepID=UPI0025E26915|nr:hypothetical protein [uncultured Sphingomonas sp.]
MMPDQPRLAVLQRRRIRKTRAPEVAAAWAHAGVAASVLSDLRHEELIDLIRGSGTRTLAVGSLQSIVADFGNGSDMLVIIGWDIENEPALLIRSAALARSGASLRTIYAEGFVVANQPTTRALIVEFEDAHFKADQVRLVPGG